MTQDKNDKKKLYFVLQDMEYDGIWVVRYLTEEEAQRELKEITESKYNNRGCIIEGKIIADNNYQWYDALEGGIKIDVPNFR